MGSRSLGNHLDLVRIRNLHKLLGILRLRPGRTLGTLIKFAIDVPRDGFAVLSVVESSVFIDYRELRDGHFLAFNRELDEDVPPIRGGL